MDALILAGGETPIELAASLPESVSDRALIPINGRPVIDYILQSFCGCDEIGEIAVAGHQNTLEHVAQDFPEVIQVEAQEEMIDNLMNSVNRLKSDFVLVCTCDVPLATAETWKEFFKKTKRLGLDAAYPIVEKKYIESTFSGGQRTYVAFSERTFTGGNAFIIRRDKIEPVREVITSAYRSRKNPLAIAKLLGPVFLFKALTRKLTIPEIEQKISKLLNCRAGAVNMTDAAIAFDIDKFEDLTVAEITLTKREERQ